MEADYSGPVSALDRQGMANLKRIASNQDRQALRQVAKQFESLFLEMIMKDMRATVPEGGLFDSSQVKAWQSMHDQQLSINLSGGLGIAGLLERQLGGGEQPAAATHFPLSMPTYAGESNQSGEKALASLKLGEIFARFVEENGQDSPALKTKKTDVVDSDLGDNNRLDGTPGNFVKALWNSARKYAPQLGLDPVFMIGQAALETGWGGKVIRHGDGRNSHNLFGIKAGNGWQGEKVQVSTLEYTDGVVQRRQEPFRSYASFEESFADYASFLQQPRYKEVLGAGSDLLAFAQGLQSSGYATDPKYAEKIMQIVQRERIQTEVTRIRDGS